ncbi:Clp protease N-terminal domain-containing protein [Actinokineospora auranticolor]|uniref:ClpA/ClpB-like protein n=1 Tax=Actinokineospora auranticolor TaxID=155976 RepID=A0A2S6GY92_9PSEU|nr:Clp protease N-terminal domain-containing protein [Actinokineospora auranticolor]PPK70199.1 ClpA/ClpB-like protein [Actinokineospora auranticolor]
MNATPQLSDLITTVEGRSADPLTRLADAVVLARRLDEVADHLIGHFVDRARHSGASWTAIGDSIGVSKQAAQKRFVPSEPATAEADLRIFARYSDAARQVVVRSQEEALTAGHTEIRPGHLLLALLRDPDVAALATDVAAARAAATDELGPGGTPASGPVPFAPAGKKVFDLAHRESLDLDGERIWPEHLLLGLLAANETDELPGGVTRARVEAALRARGE